MDGGGGGEEGGLSSWRIKLCGGAGRDRKERIEGEAKGGRPPTPHGRHLGLALPSSPPRKSKPRARSRPSALGNYLRRWLAGWRQLMAH